jgi:hypothetical protein
MSLQLLLAELLLLLLLTELLLLGLHL